MRNVCRILILGCLVTACRTPVAFEDTAIDSPIVVSHASFTTYRFEPADRSGNADEGGVAFFIELSARESGKPVELAGIEFEDRTERIAVFEDGSRIAARLWHGSGELYYDCNLPAWGLVNRRSHLALTWDFSNTDPIRFLSLRIDGQIMGMYHTENDAKTGVTPELKTGLRASGVEFSAPPASSPIQHRIDSIRWFRGCPSIEQLDDHLNSFSMFDPTIHLDVSNFRTFSGRDIPSGNDDGRLIRTVDSLIARSPTVNLIPGSYRLMIVARCSMESVPNAEIADLLVSADPSAGSAASFPLRRSDFQTSDAYERVEREFELKEAVEARIELRMKRFGYADFMLDYIGIIGPVTDHWDAVNMERTLGDAYADPANPGRTVIKNAHALAFGPYRPLPRIGRYTAVFEMKLDPSVDLDSICTIEVYAHDGVLYGSRGNKSYGITGLGRQQADGQFHRIEIPFFYDGAEMMEYRTLVYTIAPGSVDFAGVDLVYEGSAADTGKRPVTEGVEPSH